MGLRCIRRNGADIFVARGVNFPQKGGGGMLKCKVGAKSRMSLVNDILLILIRHGNVGVLRTLGERCLAANELEPVVQARMTVVGKLHRECSSALLRHLAYSDLEMTRSA